MFNLHFLLIITINEHIIRTRILGSFTYHSFIHSLGVIYFYFFCCANYTITIAINTIKKIFLYFVHSTIHWKLCVREWESAMRQFKFMKFTIFASFSDVFFVDDVFLDAQVGATLNMWICSNFFSPIAYFSNIEREKTDWWSICLKKKREGKFIIIIRMFERIIWIGSMMMMMIMMIMIMVCI